MHSTFCSLQNVFDNLSASANQPIEPFSFDLEINTCKQLASSWETKVRKKGGRNRPEHQSLKKATVKEHLITLAL